MGPRRLAGQFRASLKPGSTTLTLPYDIDCLVYSSHKSGTETLRATLNHSGIPAYCIHQLRNAAMPSGHGVFRSYLAQYRRRTNRKLDVVSTFRLPWERHMSSFFQWYGTGAVRKGWVRTADDTVIARLNVDELQQLFLGELRDGSLAGRHDSLHELCGELGLEVTALPFDVTSGFGTFENDLVRLHLFRFDLLFVQLASLLEEALNVPVSPKTANFSPDKWYWQKFQEFASTLTAQPDLIKTIHAPKKDLIDVFYPDRYQEILNEHLARYAGLPDSEGLSQ